MVSTNPVRPSHPADKQSHPTLMSADADTGSSNPTFDCIVVGSGHAGSCAALAARDAGCARVLLVDKCPQEWAGGNGFFTAGAHRTVHSGLADLLPLVRNVPPSVADTIDLAPYTAEEFAGDINRLGSGQADPALVKAVVEGSREAVGWLAERVKVPFTLAFNRQAYLVNGRQVFWGGLVLSVEDGGKGLIAAHRVALEKAGVEVWFDTAAEEVVLKDGSVAGLVVSRNGVKTTLNASAVVLACGGFEASRTLRSQHMGSDWGRAMVRTLMRSHGTITINSQCAHFAFWPYFRCAARPTILGMVSRLASAQAHGSPGTSRVVTRRVGTRMHPRNAVTAN